MAGGLSLSGAAPGSFFLRTNLQSPGWKSSRTGPVETDTALLSHSFTLRPVDGENVQSLLQFLIGHARFRHHNSAAPRQKAPGRRDGPFTERRNVCLGKQLLMAEEKGILRRDAPPLYQYLNP